MTLRIELPNGEWLGRHLTQIREWKGWSQAKMAKELSLSGNSAVSYYETRPGKRLKGLMIEKLREIADLEDADIVVVPSSGSGGELENNMEIDEKLTEHSNDTHSEIRHYFIVNIEDGDLIHCSESIARNPQLKDGITKKYADRGGEFARYFADERNIFNLTKTIDSYVFAFKIKERSDLVLFGRIPVHGDSFRFMAEKRKMESVIEDIAPLLS